MTHSEIKDQQEARGEDIIDAFVMESYFREHMAERDLLFLDLVAPHLAAYNPLAARVPDILAINTRR